MCVVISKCFLVFHAFFQTKNDVKLTKFEEIKCNLYSLLDDNIKKVTENNN